MGQIYASANWLQLAFSKVLKDTLWSWLTRLLRQLLLSSSGTKGYTVELTNMQGYWGSFRSSAVNTSKYLLTTKGMQLWLAPPIP